MFGGQQQHSSGVLKLGSSPYLEQLYSVTEIIITEKISLLGGISVLVQKGPVSLEWGHPGMGGSSRGMFLYDHEA